MYREPDTSQNADSAKIEAALFGRTEAEANSRPLRFSLWQLLTATTLAAALLALFRAVGIWGAVFAFVVAIVCSLTAYGRDRQRQVLLFDFIWGIVMPVVCFVYDPFVFKDEPEFLGAGGAPSLHPQSFSDAVYLLGRAFVGYPVLAWQLAALAIVLVAGRLRGWWAAGFAGTLFVGLAVAGLIGLLLLPIAALATLLLIGLLGFTPLLTAFSFGRRVGVLWTQALSDLPLWKVSLGAVIGALLAAVVPGGLGLALVVAVRGWDAISP
jgi:hypothetical protein